MEKKKIAIVGCGHLGNIVAQAWRSGLLPSYTLIGCLSRTPAKAAAMAAECGAHACTSLDQLLALAPDYIIETASVVAVQEMALPALQAGCSLVLLSVGALADEAFYAQVRQAAEEHNAKVYLASGAVGGFDVLRTATLMATAAHQPLSASIHTQKGPASLQNTPLFRPELMQGERSDVFRGNAAQAIAQLPTKVNVAVAAALATAGPHSTDVIITSVPGYAGDDHCITVKTEGIQAVVDVYSRTSDIAGWSVVALLQNLASPIVM